MSDLPKCEASSFKTNPFTGNDFWPKLLGKWPNSSGDARTALNKRDDVSTCQDLVGCVRGGEQCLGVFSW